MTDIKAKVDAAAADIKCETGEPKWLLVMRAITGLTEEPGDPDNPKILAMARYIGLKFPDMKSYTDVYQHDETAWCGLTAAFCMSVANIRPPFGPTDTDKFLWALSWENWMDGMTKGGGKIIGSPVLGCVVVMTRSGGGHVTLFESVDGNGNYRCRGGNQSDAVNVQSYDPDDVVALVWPTAAGDVPQIPVEQRPLLVEGDSGPDVFDMQSMIPNFTGDIDGDFGPQTEENVRRYQASRGLDVDGECGQQTWTALYENTPPLPPPPGALTYEQQSEVMKIANESAIADYGWRDRGIAPTGYTQGMALAFAQSYKKLKAGHAAVVQMARARTSSDKDALNEYREDFEALNMSNEEDGADTLRHLYALMLGQGMRESSGQHCEGRDMSADNVTSDTAEAGLFQTSYNASNASEPEFDILMDEYLAGLSPGYLEAFSEGVSCSSSDWENYGSGRGEAFQRLCKEAPAFAAESCGLTLRNLCNHYGPINRHETELKLGADVMFQAVQDYMDESEAVA